MIYLMIFCAGGVGAALRFSLDTWFKARFTPQIPLGIFLINITGSFFLGLLTGLMSQLPSSPPSEITKNVELVLGVGLLGGYTTFSTALLEAVAHPSKPGTLALALIQSLLAVCAALIGLVIGTAVA